MTHPIKSPKKLIEVALPLDAINAAAAREKSIRHGHPSTLHLWWARRPLAAARAVIFAQLVNDPGYQQGGGFKYGKNKKEAEIERHRLFKILEDLVKWENTTNEEVLEAARAEIRRSWREVCELNKDHPQAAELFNPDKMPGLHDPFAGGGAIPLEAQRLGLEAFASDLNPVAVLINKAMIEIPPKFAGRAPVGPIPKGEQIPTRDDWPGATGLAEDVRRYGAWMREEAEKRIGHLYPKVEITEEMAKGRPDLKGLVGQKLTVVAWMWARTVRSPNPAFSHIDVPLVSTFVLSDKDGSGAYIEPIVDSSGYRFSVRLGPAPEKARNGTKLARGANFRCIVSDTAIEPAHIYAEAKAGRMGARLTAMVVAGPAGRLYLPPTSEMEHVALGAKPEWKPDVRMPDNPRWFSPPLYGLTTYGDIFTARQLVALTTFCDLVSKGRDLVFRAAAKAGMADDGVGLESDGRGATAYADAIAAYLGLVADRLADRNSSLCGWDLAQAARGREATVRNVFSRQAIPMTWDYAEVNIIGDAAGGYESALSAVVRVLERIAPARVPGTARQADAATQMLTAGRLVSTDPPYYDNIGYADLSDFFYVWLRRALRKTFPSLLATVAVPKAEELVATPYRHGSRDRAEAFFLAGMTSAMKMLAAQAHPANPITIYYAFKQSETKVEQGTSSTGWETFLDAVYQSGLEISGTWPMRTELSNRMISSGTNALASSIVLVCRKRPADAPTVSRREFLRELNTVLPEALDEMTKGSGEDRSPVAPVDLSQAIIGPGMAIFSKYTAVLEADGSPMSVRTALQLINRFLAEDDFDHDTQFCLHWFDQHGWDAGVYGEADVLARAKGTSVGGLVEAGVAQSNGGKVRLLRPADYPADWDPRTDKRLPVWEALHQLIRAFRAEGESAAGQILAAPSVKARSEAIRQLAYRLYTVCERRGDAEDARPYNELVTSWSAIEAAAGAVPEPAAQLDLFGGKGR
jgi:putative DNA methylase